MRARGARKWEPNDSVASLRWPSSRSASTAHRAGPARSAAASSWCRSTSPSPTAPASTSTDLDRGRFRGLRGRRQAEADVLLADAAADLAGAPARHQRQHGRADGHRAGGGDRLRQAAAQGRPGRGHRLRQPGPDPAELHQRRRVARKGDPPDDRQWLDLALQRALHRAQGAQEGEGDDGRPTSAARRSSCSPTATTPRA